MSDECERLARALHDQLSGTSIHLIDVMRSRTPYEDLSDVQRDAYLRAADRMLAELNEPSPKIHEVCIADAIGMADR
jgi:hypothetical protein